jgi:hypothetical protein
MVGRLWRRARSHACVTTPQVAIGRRLVVVIDFFFGIKLDSISFK